MKKRINRLIAMGLVLTMVGGTAAGAEAVETEAASGADTAAASGEKWSAAETADGWIKVTNEGGETLGYSKDSGVTLIEDEGYAFKDMDQDGELDVYEDWRQDDATRAADLASKMSGEEIAPLLTHGGWMSFGKDIGGDEEYLAAGGRAGVTRSAGNEGNTEMAVIWNNTLQEYAEANGGYGVPITISIDPNYINDMPDKNGLGATMDTEVAKESGQEQAKAFRSVGITMLLGPQIDVSSESSWDRTSGTYSEDPALNCDLTNAFVSGLQSTYDEDGNDLGWGDDSVVAIVKHYAGAGASEGGRNDHSDSGKYTVFPGNNFAAHLVPFFDGAFQLDSVTGKAAGLMPNYGISYSEDGSLGEEVGGGYSEFKIDLLRDNDYDGFILTDWQITEDPDGAFGSRAFGVEDMTEGERFAALFEVGVDQVGGTTSIDAAIEGYQIMAEDMGEEAALENMRGHAARFFITQLETGLYENPYLDMEEAVAAAWTDEAKAKGAKMQEGSYVMLKNSDNTIHEYASSAEKAAVYIPYVYKTSGAPWMGYTYSCEPAVDIDLAGQYYNVVTDSLGDPSGEDADGNAIYVPEDIIRASAEDIASCEYAIVSMKAPYTDGTTDEDGNYLPASMQYEEYTADTAPEEAIANGSEIVEISDGYYGVTTQEVEEDRSYQGNTAAQPSTYEDYKTLQYVDGAVSEDCKVIVVMGSNSAAAMVWSEVEPLADAILLYDGEMTIDQYAAETIMSLITGQTEPSGLLIKQQPASMEAVEAQLEDVPRDAECYVDADGNTYDFAFGLNWSGVISDERAEKYRAEPLTTPESITFTYANE
ncbi:MAG: glycoside hydrolase family 3 N-terminal domain-containing protein [Lachnospiraceae bacterium]|nr:glycoside hydrolase family 3 N-terminal domain-containing protein [Lachnospiraceae bacterium]